MNITVYGSPIAQPRLRARAFMGKGGKFTAGVYEPQTVKDAKTGLRRVNPIYEWKQNIKRAAREQLGLTEQSQPLITTCSPIHCSIDIYFPRTRELEKAKYPDGAIPHTKKPDRDNIEKGILDALRGIAFADDCAVCGGEVRKWYCARNTVPRAEIYIVEVYEQPVLAAARAKRKI